MFRLFSGDTLNVMNTGVLALIAFLNTGSILGQADSSAKEGFISAYGFSDVSATGQDTLYFYYQTRHTELFGPEYILDVRRPYPEIIRSFKEFFETRLNDEDLVAVQRAWEIRYEAYKESTRERGPAYCTALECQRLAIDSLIHSHEGTLLAYQNKVISTLNQSQKALIGALHLKCMTVLERKKQSFLAYEREYTLEVTPCIYNYMEYGFELMRLIPCANYYNLLGVNLSALNFIDSLGVEEYFNAYADFEIELTRILGRPGCKAHLAIPFFVESINNDRVTTFRKRNAMLYLFLKAFPEVVPLSENPVAVILDSIHIPHFQDTPLVIEDLIDESMLRSYGYSLVPIEPGVLTFMKEGSMSKGGEVDIVGYIPFPSAIEKRENLNRMNTIEQRSSLIKREFNNGTLYYSIDKEESRDATSFLLTLDGVLIHGNEMLGFMWMISSEEDFEERLESLISVIQF